MDRRKFLGFFGLIPVAGLVAKEVVSGLSKDDPNKWHHAIIKRTCKDDLEIYVNGELWDVKVFPTVITKEQAMSIYTLQPYICFET